MTKRIKHIKWKRVISAILCVVLLVGALPMSVFAQELNAGESTTQQNPQDNNQSTVLPNDDNTPQNTLNNTIPSDYPQNDKDILDVRQPQTVGVSTERPASFANNTANLTYESGYTGTAASKFNSGTGTSADPYIIKTGAQLKYFADQVNAGNTFSGKYIKLDANINLNGKNWTPIGYSRSFAGNFDGNYHEIKNMNITYSSGNALDSETYYIGFWGKVSNATIKNLGIADYTVNQKYSFHTVIGGFAAQVDASTIQNCYADGDITANFGGLYYVGMTKTLKGQSNVYTITSVANIPNNTDSIPNSNVLIDLSSVDSQEIGKTFTIGSNISTVQFIGKSGATYSKFNIVIGSAATDVNIIFENFSISGNSSSGTIYSAADRQINIYTCGTENTIDSSVAAPALNVPSASTTIMGEAKITFKVSGLGAEGAYPGKAGNGKNGAAGNPGSSGSAGMIADSVLIYANNVVCVGGQGGAGSKGGQGNSSTFKTKKSGGRGGDGGAGGSGLVVNNLGIIRGAFSITGGKGGSGGQGGTPGALGTAGTGGTGGTGGTALVITGSVYGIEPQLTAGAGGDKGPKGLAGGVDTGKDGSAGSAGAGGATSNPATYSVLAISSYTYSPIVVEAQLTIGGFVAVATGKTTISNSAVIIDSITTPSNYPNDKLVKYWFVAQNNIPTNSGKIDSVLTLKTNGQTYTKYSEGDSFGGAGAKSTSSATILTGFVDGQNITYATGINSSGEYNDVIETIVIGKSGAKSDIVIPDAVFAGRFIMPVVAIDNGALWNNTLVKNVTLGKNITKIGEAAFMGSSIESFTDSEKNIIVGNRAFANCASLTLVDVSNATDLGEVTFYGCTALGSASNADQRAVTLGDNLTEIKKGVFYNCVKLSKIEIPKNVVTIGVSSFFGSGLSEVDYSGATALTTIKDSAFAMSTSLVKATIPNTVQTVEPCAYYGCTAITTLSIGNNVKTIGEAAFYGCSSLKGAIVPTNVTTIGASVFGGCSKLESITVPFVGSTKSEDDKTHFGYIFGAGTYKGNDDVVPATLASVTVLSGAKKIDEYAFCWCANIKTVCLPDTITSIGKYAFCSCGLTEAVVPDSVETIGYAAFMGCNQMTKITIPFVGASDNAEENNHFGYVFGAETFELNNQSIPESIEVVISKNATIIADKAFYGCEDVVAISIGSSVKSIGEKAFFDCLNITSIVVSDSVESIGTAAFGKTSTEIGKLESVDLGNGVKNVERDLFVGRREIKTINIGRSLEAIPELDNEKAPFGLDKSISELKTYTVDPNNPKFGASDGILYELFEVDGRKLKVAIVDVPAKAKLSSNIYTPQKQDAEGNIADDNEFYIVRIYPYAFAYNSQIKEVHLDYVRSIGTGAFSNCSSLETIIFGQYEERTGTVQILEDTCPIASEKYSTIVGNSAFENCTKLHEINLESNALTKIGLNAFYNCATAEGIKPLSLTLGKNITALSATDDEIKNDVQYTVAEMMKTSFSSAFREANVREFKVADGNSTFIAVDGVLFYRSGETVGESDKDELWLAIYPRNAVAHEYTVVNDSNSDYVITYISPEAFSGAKNLRSLTIGDGVTQVGYEAFTKMTTLDKLYVGKDVVVLGGDGTISNLFDGCGALQNIYVDANNTVYSDIDGVLFDKAQHLLIKYPIAKAGSDYVTPSTVQEISKKAFLGNEKIRHITLSNTIIYIGDEAFYKCKNLSFIYFEKGDCPFATANAMKDSNAFFTTNARVLVCYGDKLNNSKWTAFSTDEANANYYSEITTQGGERSRLFQVAEYTTYPTDIANTGYYAFVVLDKSGALLNEITVSIGDDNGIDAKNGIAMFYNLPFGQPHQLIVTDNLGVYFPVINSEFYLDEATKITYITLSAVPTVSGVKVEYDVEAADKIKEILTSEASATIVGDGHKIFDINSETAKINKWLADEIVISVNCGLDLQGTIEDCYLLQNGNKIVCESIYISDYQTLGGKKYATIDFTVKTANLTNEQDVYVAVQTSDGLVQTKLNLHIFNMEFKGIDLSFLNDDWIFPVSGELQQILKGFGSELSFKPKGSKLRYSVKNEADSVKIAVSFGKNQDDAFHFDGVDAWTKYVNDIKKGQVDKFHPYKDEKVNEASLNLQGYIELKYKGLDENGNPDIEVKSGIIGTLKLTRGWGASYTIVVVPVRVEAELSLSGSLKLELVFDKEAEKLLSGSVDLTVKGALELSAGVGCKIASAGIYGSAETVIVLNIVPSFEMESWKISGDIGFYVQYRGLFVKWKKTWSLLKGMGIDAEWVLYQNGKWWFEANGQVASISDVSLANAIYDENAYEIAASSFDPEIMTFSLQGIQNTQKSDYAGIEPKMLQIGDIVYIVYQEDLNGYSDSYDEYNYQKIVYQTYNTETGEFSEVYVLDDNGYADGEYEVFYDGTNAVIVYSQLKKKLTTDNIDDMAGYVGSLEVKTAVLNGDVFIASNNTLTSNEYYDMNLRIGEVNGQITAVWVQNVENTMFGTTDNNNMSIWYSVYNGTTWNAPACLKSNVNTITDIEIGNKGVVYITDTNNDLTTVDAEKTVEGYSDRLITVLDMKGNVVLLIAEEAAYHDVSYFDDEVVYYMSNNLYSIDTNSAYFDESISALTEDYTVLTDAEGNVKAVLFVNTVVYDEEMGADGSNVFAVFCDGENWGAPIQITDFGAEVFVSAFDAVDFNDKILISVLLSEIEFSEEAIDEYDDYTTINHFETLWFDYPTNYVVGEVLFDYESIKTNSNVTISVPITNNGYQSLNYNDIPVSIAGYECIKVGFFDEEGNALANSTLASGNTGYLKVSFVTNNAEDKSYSVNVNGEDREFRIWYSDFSVVGKQVLIGDTYDIVLLVTNNGYLSGRYNISAICDKEIIWNNNQEAIELGAGESKYFIIPLETTFAAASRLIEISVNADNEYLTTNNSTVVNVTTEEDLSEQVQLSSKAITIDRSMVTDQYFDVSFEDKYTWQNVLVNGTEYAGEYTVTGNTITFNKASMASVFAENGIYTFTIVFIDDNEIEKTSTFVVTITEFFTITWVVDGKTTYEEYEVGSQLVPIDPSKDADEYYTYTFNGWDKQLQMVVTSDATYTGTFSAHRIQYEITWIVDGNEERTYVNSLEMPTHETPTKASDAEWDYTFVGWSPVVKEATENIVYTAEFAKSPRKYTVTWIVNGVETTTEHTYNEIPSIDTPQSYSDNEYFYTFKGWDKEVVSVKENTVYTAQWNSEPVNYTITWNVDGVKSYSNYTYNQTPEYGSIPTKASTEQYDYVFIGWSPEISAVTANVEYVAQFDAILRKYTVKWIIDGMLEEQELYYGELPTHFNPTKASDAQYDYVFAGWNKEPSTVYGDQEYIAQFTPVLRKYTITWIVDGSEYSSSVYYNSMPSFMGLPSREGTAQYSYIFAGWTPEVEVVTGDKTYTAVFEQVVNSYTVTWEIGDESYTDTYEYGEIPEFDGALFSEFADESHCYVFTNWDKELVAVTNDATYVASFESRKEHNFTSNVETNEYGIQYVVHTCECGYTYSVIPETTPSISVKSDSTIAGSVAEVEIVVKNNPGVLGAVLTIEFDENLKLLSAEAGDAWSTLNMTLPGTFDNICSFLWDGVSDVDADDGTILKLRFEVSANAIVGDEYSVSVSYRPGSIKGENNTAVAFMTCSGVVTIDEYSYGDVNGDGFIDVADVILIRQHLAGGYDVEINADTADVNLDGYVDVADVILIRQYLAGGYGVVLGQKQN